MVDTVDIGFGSSSRNSYSNFNFRSGELDDLVSDKAHVRTITLNRPDRDERF